MVMVESKGLELQDDVCPQLEGGAEVVWLTVEDSTEVVSDVAVDDIVVLVGLKEVVDVVDVKVVVLLVMEEVVDVVDVKVVVLLVMEEVVDVVVDDIIFPPGPEVVVDVVAPEPEELVVSVEVGELDWLRETFIVTGLPCWK